VCFPDWKIDRESVTRRLVGWRALHDQGAHHVNRRAAILLAAFFILASMAMSLDREQSFATLASTPPMGWNSWNKFGCNVSEDLIRQIADAMVTSGMKDAGYQYVVIDDCW
jgi:alpha-galactosidase